MESQNRDTSSLSKPVTEGRSSATGNNIEEKLNATSTTKKGNDLAPIYDCKYYLSMIDRLRLVI